MTDTTPLHTATGIDAETDNTNTIPNRPEPGFPDTDSYIDIGVTQISHTTRTLQDGTERPLIHIFGRTPDDTFEHVVVHGFEPYFYIESNDDHKVGDDNRVKQIQYGHTTIRGVDAARVTTYLPGDISGQGWEDGVRDLVDDNHYEADIPFSNRFLLDKNIQSGVRVPERRRTDGTIAVPDSEVEPADVSPNLRVLNLDIEVEDRNGFPEDGEEPLICFTTHDSYNHQYIVWFYDAEDGESGPEKLPEYEMLDDEASVEIVKLDSEVAMMRAFLSYIEELNPDVLTGWNFTGSDGFDAPYVIDRLEILNDRTDNDIDLNPDRLARVGGAWNGWETTITGRIVFDLLEAYKRTQFSELDSYRLDAVGATELDVGKETYMGTIGDLWETDPERLLEYNLRDVELCVGIDEKQSVIDFWEEVRMFVGCTLDDAPIPGDAVDMYVLHKSNGRFVLPSKAAGESEDYEGGAVFEPITGVRENVVVEDLKSLYPMCMKTINASPETKVDDPESYDGETFVAPTGTHFQKEPDGIIREIIDETLSEREEKKQLRNEHEPGSEEYARYDRQQGSVKVIMNSLYGVLGWVKFRLYDKEMGAAVTATGREVIKKTEESVEALGNEVIYGDTDSVMFSVGDDVTKGEAVEAGFKYEDEINARYDDFAKTELNADTHYFKIEFEKLYKRFFQAGKKKRYAGLITWKEGKDVNDTDITGFEYKRSDIAQVTKTTQKEVLHMIVHGEDPDDIQDYVTGIVEDFRNGDIPVDDIGIPGGIGKRLDEYESPTAQVRGAIYANLFLDTNFQRGSKPKRLYLENVDSGFFRQFDDDTTTLNTSDEQSHFSDFKQDPDVICYEYPEQIPDAFDVDRDTMLEKTLKKPISRVTESIGIDWSEVTVPASQQDLDAFM